MEDILVKPTCVEPPAYHPPTRSEVASRVERDLRDALAEFNRTGEIMQALASDIQEELSVSPASRSKSQRSAVVFVTA
jgi:hypothetical protein